MKISAKGCYALASVVSMARQNTAENITVISLSERLGISKIYLEQVFSLLKRGGLVVSVKGAQGGYQLAKAPEQITVLEVLSAVELTLFEKPNETVKEKAPEIESAMRGLVFDALDTAVADVLTGVSIRDLADEAEKHMLGDAPMFYI